MKLRHLHYFKLIHINSNASKKLINNLDNIKKLINLI